ncbi:MAG: hypothetical protein HDQ88_01035 [Clostridia bacterium]|nr:hypothetical protein [Clostridia bacterium]
MAFEPIDVYLWQEQVFNYRVAKGYLTFKQLANFEIFSGEYQREIEQEHEDKIVQYLKNARYRYLPDIIIMVRDKNLDLSKSLQERSILLQSDELEIRQINSLILMTDMFIELGYMPPHIPEMYRAEFELLQSLVCNDSTKDFSKYIMPNSLLKLQIKNQVALKKIKVVDGNHRLSAIKKLLEDKESSFDNNIVCITFILMREEEGSIKDELALFYYLNSKSKPLLPKDYLSNTLKEFEDSKELKPIDLWLYIFKKSNDEILKIFQDYQDKLEKDIIARACDYIAKKNQDDEESLIEFFSFVGDKINQKEFQKILRDFSAHNQLAEFICIVFFLYKTIGDNKSIKLEAEIKYFCEWLLEDAKLEKFQDFENLFLVYQNTYTPKNFKIFIAMEFKDNDKIFQAIKGTIQHISLEVLGNKNYLQPLRIDKHIKGTTYKIIDEIFNQIDERGLVIADITNKNPNVYLEVGYTLALCRTRGVSEQLILLLKDEENKQETEKVGFDLQGYKQIRYKDTEDLRQKLEKELEEYYQTKYIPKKS